LRLAPCLNSQNHLSTFDRSGHFTSPAGIAIACAARRPPCALIQGTRDLFRQKQPSDDFGCPVFPARSYFTGLEETDD
jgi:hypothetical protein